MRILVDTNVLVRSAHVGSPDQAVATVAVRKLRDRQHELRTVPQVPYEYWAVASRAAAHNGLGFTVEDVAAQVSDIQILFPTLRDERGILGRWEELALDFKVQGKQVHDASAASQQKIRVPLLACPAVLSIYGSSAESVGEFWSVVVWQRGSGAACRRHAAPRAFAFIDVQHR